MIDNEYHTALIGQQYANTDDPSQVPVLEVWYPNNPKWSAKCIVNRLSKSSTKMQLEVIKLSKVKYNLVIKI